VPSTALDRAVTTVVRQCLAVREGEDVLVVADPRSRELGERFRDEAAAAGADPVLALMDERGNDGAEPPPTIAAALAAADVFLAPTSRSLSHTGARKAASDAGARGATLPGVTADMLARLMSVDFDALTARCRAVADLLEREDAAHLTCPRGSDFRLDLSGRHGISDDGELTARGAFGNLPCGEGFIAPASGEGTIAASSVPLLGIVEEPVLLRVDGGELAGAEGDGADAFLGALDAHGSRGRNLAELGVGTNDHARLTGNVLEDEKILGTTHVAFGASAGIGGTVSVPIHLDVVVLDATLDIGSTRVLDGGRWAL